MFRMISDCGTECFDPVPTRNVEFRVASGLDPCHFLIQSGDRNFAEFPVSVYDDFPAGILLPSSGFFAGRIWWEVLGNWQESARKNAVSSGIRPDLVTGIIDLGIDKHSVALTQTYN